MVKTPLLKVKNLTKSFPVGGLLGKNYLIAVDRVSFEILGDKPVITTIAGESGSGKSTIANLILGFLNITTGAIEYCGKSVVEMLKRNRETYRKEVQAVFQDPYGSYNPFYKVDHTLMTTIKNFKLASSKNEARKLMDDALEAVGLTPERALDKYPHQLSGGEAQRAMLARAILPQPRLLVADEPVSMVDSSLRAGILNVLLDLKREYDMSILFITHDLSVAYYLSDSIILLNRGRVVEMGNTEAVLKSPVHPYAQLLINSVPVPNPELRWKEELDLGNLEEELGERSGCIFSKRCPHQEDRCLKEAPQLMEVDPDHHVACHLRMDEAKGHRLLA